MYVRALPHYGLNDCVAWRALMRRASCNRNLGILQHKLLRMCSGKFCLMTSFTSDLTDQTVLGLVSSMCVQCCHVLSCCNEGSCKELNPSDSDSA